MCARSTSTYLHREIFSHLYFSDNNQEKPFKANDPDKRNHISNHHHVCGFIIILWERDPLPKLWNYTVTCQLAQGTYCQLLMRNAIVFPSCWGNLLCQPCVSKSHFVAFGKVDFTWKVIWFDEKKIVGGAAKFQNVPFCPFPPLSPLKLEVKCVCFCFNVWKHKAIYIG